MKNYNKLLSGSLYIFFCFYCREMPLAFSKDSALRKQYQLPPPISRNRIQASETRTGYRRRVAIEVFKIKLHIC